MNNADTLSYSLSTLKTDATQDDMDGGCAEPGAATGSPKEEAAEQGSSKRNVRGNNEGDDSEAS